MGSLGAFLKSGASNGLANMEDFTLIEDSVVVANMQLTLPRRHAT